MNQLGNPGADVTQCESKALKALNKLHRSKSCPRTHPRELLAPPAAVNPKRWRCWGEGLGMQECLSCCSPGNSCSFSQEGTARVTPVLSTHVSVAWLAAAHGWRANGSCKSTGGKTKRQLVSVPQEGRILWKRFQPDPEPLRVCPNLPNSKWTRFIQVSIKNLTCNKSEVKHLQFSIITEQEDAEDEPKQNLHASGIASPAT